MSDLKICNGTDTCLKTCLCKELHDPFKHESCKEKQSLVPCCHDEHSDGRYRSSEHSTFMTILPNLNGSDEPSSEEELKTYHETVDSCKQYMSDIKELCSSLKPIIEEFEASFPEDNESDKKIYVPVKVTYKDHSEVTWDPKENPILALMFADNKKD